MSLLAQNMKSQYNLRCNEDGPWLTECAGKSYSSCRSNLAQPQCKDRQSDLCGNMCGEVVSHATSSVRHGPRGPSLELAEFICYTADMDGGWGN